MAVSPFYPNLLAAGFSSQGESHNQAGHHWLWDLASGPTHTPLKYRQVAPRWGRPSVVENTEHLPSCLAWGTSSSSKDFLVADVHVKDGDTVCFHGWYTSPNLAVLRAIFREARPATKPAR